MEIPYEFFLNTHGNSTSFLIEHWNFHMLFLQYPWKFHVLTPLPPLIWIFSGVLAHYNTFSYIVENKLVSSWFDISGY